MNITNYKAKGIVTSGEGVEVELLEGTQGSTVIKCLEIINSANPASVKVYRKKVNNEIYGEITLTLKSQDYLLLWESFVVIPAGEKLCFISNSPNVELVASVVEI